MRQRKAKDLDKRLARCSGYMVEPIGEGEARRYFVDRDAAEGDVMGHDKRRKLFLEIGCGKGNFIIKKAQDNPGDDFLAAEGQETVLLRAVEKLSELDGGTDADGAGSDGSDRDGRRGSCPQNLRFMLTFVNRMADFFDEGQLAGIYLNFSDPWPKARHKKRRLTYRKRLQDYAWALEDGGFIEIKTDNDGLYEFTLEEIEAEGLTIVEQTTDLHNSEFESKYTMTEYEEKFSSRGKNINYVKVISGKRNQE